MKNQANKTCDICNDLLAIKQNLFYKTEKKYITIKERKNVFGEEQTTKKHICNICFINLTNKIKQELKKER